MPAHPDRLIVGMRDDVIAFAMSERGKYVYTQDSRRYNPVVSGATDCSAWVRHVFMTVANVEVGWWTGAQQSYGSRVFGAECQTQADAMRMLMPGDLVFFDWDGINVPVYNHVDMYLGNGKLIGHGGPGKGPNVYSLTGQWNAAHTIIARRYLAVDTPSNGPVAASWPSWPLSSSDYFGNIRGPERSHGGHYVWERSYIKLIQEYLWDNGFVADKAKYTRGNWCDGLFEAETILAVAAWQRAKRPGTAWYGQVWSDDWAHIGRMV